MNDDFSFVRFLKVVKTLYESSTFTQLGKTVGSVLKDGKEEDDGVVDNDSYHRDMDEESERARNESVFEAIHKACVLSSKSSRDEMDVKGKNGMVKKRGKGQNDSILEQVLNTCTVFTQPDGDDMTDEGNITLQNSTDNFSEYDDTAKSSFDTFSEDEYEDRKRRTRSKRR